MSEIFEPRIVAYVCNWCTYLGADLAGTTRLEYPPNVRIIRLPCTGRIDFNLLVKAFEVGADAVLVSGCHPGDCHYTSGNYHARRRWTLFRALLDTLGFDMRRIHFTWISAAESRKFQETITRITEETRQLGPYGYLGTLEAAGAAGPAIGKARAAADPAPELQAELRALAHRLLSEGDVKVVVGYGERGPVFVTRPEDTDRLVWNGECRQNLAAYLKRKEVRALGKAALVVKGCDERSLVALEKESHFDRRETSVIGMACDGMGEPKCDACQTPAPRFADHTIGAPHAALADGAGSWGELDAFLARPPAERMAWWAGEFERCVKCYACRQSCPMCYCERCLVEKNRPVEIGTSPTPTGNFAWHITRAFHLAGRCAGCDACTTACPAGIDLRLLNLALARAAEQEFGFRAGMDPDVPPLMGSWAATDKEGFIR